MHRGQSLAGHRRGVTIETSSSAPFTRSFTTHQGIIEFNNIAQSIEGAPMPYGSSELL